MPVMKRGALIVLEGCDRSGKSTQCKLLRETLLKKGHSTELLRFPERSTAIGKVISEYLENKNDLEDHAVHLLFSANRWELLPKMKDILYSGTSIIIDRYAYSGVAFTAAKEGFTIDWCKRSDAGLPLPDLVLYLTLNPDEAAKRGEFGNERYEQTDFQKRVAKNFEVLRQEENWVSVDASCDMDTLHTKLTELVVKTITNEKDNDLKPLWVEEEKLFHKMAKTD